MSSGTTCDPVRVCGGTSAVGEWSGQNLVCTLEGIILLMFAEFAVLRGHAVM